MSNEDIDSVCVDLLTSTVHVKGEMLLSKIIHTMIAHQIIDEDLSNVIVNNTYGELELEQLIQRYIGVPIQQYSTSTSASTSILQKMSHSSPSVSSPRLPQSSHTTSAALRPLRTAGPGYSPMTDRSVPSRGYIATTTAATTAMATAAERDTDSRSIRHMPQYSGKQAAFY